MSIAVELDSRVRATQHYLGIARVQFLFFTLLVFVSLFLILRDFNSYQFGYTPDSVEYTIFARSLIRGPSAQRVTTLDPADQQTFPFGYSSLLTPFVIGLPRYETAPQLVSLGATFVNAVLLFWCWRVLVPGFSNLWRYSVTAMTLLAPVSVVQARLILSEPVFITSLLLAFIFAERLRVQPGARRLWVGLGVALFFLVFTRSVGWVLSGSFVLYLLIVQRGKAVRGLVTIGLALAIFIAGIIMLAPDQSANLLPFRYVQEYSRVGQRFPLSQQSSGLPNDPLTGGILRHLSILLSLRLDDLRHVLLLTGGGNTERALAERLGAPWLGLLPALLAVGLLLLGNVDWARRTFSRTGQRISLFQFSALCYLLAILFWLGSGDRLLYPVAPQLYLALLLGGLVCLQSIMRAAAVLVHPGETTRLRLQKLPAAILVMAILGWLALAGYRDWTLRSSYEIWGDLNERTAWLEANLPPDAILVSDWAALDSFKTGLRTAWFPRSNGTAQLWAQLQELHGSYLVLALDMTTPTFGISVEGERVETALPYLRELVARGQLIPVYSNHFPLQVWRIEQ